MCRCTRLRADIDYGFREARTTTGRVGVKVWIYKGDILPYKTSAEDKISREAAMAVGETSGQARPAASSAPVVAVAGPSSASPARLRQTVAEAESSRCRPPDAEGDRSRHARRPPADDALERLLAEEEEIERRTRDQHHDVPHFRREND